MRPRLHVLKPIIAVRVRDSGFDVAANADRHARNRHIALIELAIRVAVKIDMPFNDAKRLKVALPKFFQQQRNRNLQRRADAHCVFRQMIECFDLLII